MLDLNLFDMMGLEVPKKEEPKKEKKEKSSKPAVKTKAEAKLNVKLPLKTVIQGVKTLEISAEMLSLSDGSTSDKIIKEYLGKEYPITKMMDYSFEKDICYVGFYPGGTSGTMEVKGDSTVVFGNFKLSLAEVTGGEGETSKVESSDFANYITGAGLPLGEELAAVKFIEKSVGGKSYVIPIPKECSDNDIQNGLVLPVVITMYGDYDDVIIDEALALELSGSKDIKDVKLTNKLLMDAVIKTYPEFDKHIQICALDKGMNTVCAMMVPIMAVSTKKEVVFEITDNTKLMFYAQALEISKEHLPCGSYTEKELYKVIAKQCALPAFNNTKEITHKKMGDTYFFAVKFGGSKGAEVLADSNELVDTFSRMLEKKYSSYTAITGNNDYVCIQPSYYVVESDKRNTFMLRLPKIPNEIYCKVISLFQKVAQIYNKECLARIYWDIEKEQYDLIIPFQKANIASVTAVADGFPNEDYVFTHIPVLEVHSHGLAYDAFFSSIDDASELSKYSCYGVFSFKDGINADIHQLFRCCCGSEHTYKITKDNLFEDGDYVYDGEFVKTILSFDRLG